jgi:hypothetical protein
MGFNYQREEPKSRLETGDYRVEIVEAANAVSSKGNEMIVLSIRPNLSEIKLKYYLVEGKYFNQNATQIFDSFDIEEGDFDLPGWIGAQGVAHIVPDDRNPRYMKIAYFHSRATTVAENLPPWKGVPPERHRIVDGNEFVQVDDSEDPF